MIEKTRFIECAKALKAYYDWEVQCRAIGFYAEEAPAAEVANMLWQAMIEFDNDQAYDARIDVDWIAELMFGEQEVHKVEWGGRKFCVVDWASLYDFLAYRHEHWDDEPNKDWRGEFCAWRG